MIPAVFVMTRPCLDEIEGYREQLRIMEMTYPTEDLAPLLRYETELLEGKTLPAVTNHPDRTWNYRRKRKPVRRRQHAF